MNRIWNWSRTRIIEPSWERAEPLISNVFEGQLRVLKVALVVGFLWSFAVFIAVNTYFVFYFLFIPKGAIHFPLYFNFRNDAAPQAIIGIEDSYFYPGQDYVIRIELELPESPINQDIGMVMVNLDGYTDDGKVFSTFRPIRMKYKSQLVQVIHKLFFGLPLIFGIMEESQFFSIVLAEDLRTSFTEARISLSKPLIELYNSHLFIEPKLTGLRYVTYHWFFTSAFVGITWIVLIEFLIAMIIWIIISTSSSSGSTTSKQMNNKNRSSIISNASDIDHDDDDDKRSNRDNNKSLEEDDIEVLDENGSKKESIIESASTTGASTPIGLSTPPPTPTRSSSTTSSPSLSRRLSIIEDDINIDQLDTLPPVTTATPSDNLRKRTPLVTKETDDETK